MIRTVNLYNRCKESKTKDERIKELEAKLAEAQAFRDRLIERDIKLAKDEAKFYRACKIGEDMATIADGLKTKLAEAEKKVCYWTENEHGDWIATCGNALSSDACCSPNEYGMKFCDNCGGKLIEVKYVEEFT